MLSFGAPPRFELLFGRLSENRNSMPQLRPVPRKNIFSRADFGTTIV